MWSVIRFSLLYSNVSCAFNNNKKKRKKEKQQRLSISSQRESLLSPRSPVSIRDESHERKLALWFSICQSGWLIPHPHWDWMSPALIHIKAKSEPRAYVIVGHTLNVPHHSCWTGSAAHVRERPRGLQLFVYTINPLHISPHAVNILI